MDRGFKLDPNTHDFVLVDGTFDTVEGIAATAQEIKTRILLFKGEYFLDRREGVPYFQELLQKGVPVERVISVMRQVIQSVPSVIDVPRVDVSLDRANRVASVSWEARNTDGTLIRSEDFGPVIVEI